VFSSIGDLPLHPLVIHAAVLGVPVTLLLALLFALPRTRGWARWPLLIAGIGSLAAVYVAKESGEALQRALPRDEGVAVLIARHSALADQLFMLTIAMAALSVGAALVVGRPRGASQRSTASLARDRVLVTLLVVLAAVASFWVYRVGELGATAVWNPASTTTFHFPGR
jgi:hypothetical protein